MSKRRLDVLLVDRGLAESREKAQALVMAGQVTVDERPAPKPGVLVAETASLAVASRPRFVSRGGEKLERAFEAFGFDVTGLVVADIGASTGGFTDCLLQHGASRIYAIDVGHGQLDYRLRGDARVVVMESVNAREMAPLPEPVDFVTIDVSFISLRLVLPTAARLLRPGPAPGNPKVAPKGEGFAPGNPSTGSGRGLKVAPTSEGAGAIVALFKPQFEAAKAEVPRGGVIRDAQVHSVLVGRFAQWCVTNGFRIRDMVASPILGDAGNREFLFWLRPGSPTRPRQDAGRSEDAAATSRLGAASSAPTGAGL